MISKKQVFVLLKQLDTFVLTKKGIFLAPIITAIITMKIVPILFVSAQLCCCSLIFYRTFKVKGNKFGVFLSSLLIIIFSIILIRHNIAEARYIRGESMSPTILDQTRVVVDKASYSIFKPSRNDIVIFSEDIIFSSGKKAPRTSEEYRFNISRIIAIPGDRIEVKEGITFVNDKSVPGYQTDEQGNPYREEAFTLDACKSVKIQPAKKQSNSSVDPFIEGLGFSSSSRDSNATISDCKYILQGDNEKNVKNYVVQQVNIIGKVKAKFWPLNQVGNVE
jgi:signal peptidase I